MRTFFAFTAIFLSWTAAAQNPGQYDFNFNMNGIARFAVGSSADRLGAIAIQPNGSILMCGNSVSNNMVKASVIRVFPDGQIDTSFGQAGKVFFNFGTLTTECSDVQVQADGKIVLVGWFKNNLLGPTHNDAFIVRLNANGSLDTSFANVGYNLLDSANFDNDFKSITILSDGSILALGNKKISTSYGLYLAKFLSNGQLDLSFGISDGQRNYVDGAGGHVYADTVQVQGDGKIVVSGHSTTDFSNYLAMVLRFEANGANDNTFSYDGRMNYIHPMATTQMNRDMGILSNGKIVTVGWAAIGGKPNYVFSRINADGSIDQTFQGIGMVVGDCGSIFDGCTAQALAIQADQRILIGANVSGSNSNSYVFQLDQNGNVDQSFGIFGALEIDMGNGNADSIQDLKIAPQAKFVTAGHAQMGTSINSTQFFATQHWTGQAPSSVNEVSNSDLRIFPNPADTELQIQASNIDGTNAQVLDLTGRLMLEKVLSDNDSKLDVSVLPAGTYQIVLRSKGQFQVKSIIIQ